MDQAAIMQKLNELTLQLNELRAAVVSSEPQMPPSAIDEMNRGICLFCKLPLDDPKTATRGLHGRCYQSVTRAIRQHKTTDNAEVIAGRIGKSNVTGRPSRWDAVADQVSTSKPFLEVPAVTTGSQMPTPEPVGPENRTPVGKQKPAAKVPTKEQVKEQITEPKAAKRKGKQA